VLQSWQEKLLQVRLQQRRGLQLLLMLLAASACLVPVSE
jgi:hypothetical protein